jgi:DNA-binding HxlR family transcriptional regulator
VRAKRYERRTGCPVETTVSVIGGLWKPLILFALLEQKRRYGELCRLVPGATQRMLTLQLRELEADGAINRIVYAEVPPRVEYELTELGRSLAPVLRSLHRWGEDYQRVVVGASAGNRLVESDQP